MKIGNNGNLVLGPFDESMPCLMIVLINCQTKLRINHLTAVKLVAILESNANLNFYTWKKTLFIKQHKGYCVVIVSPILDHGQMKRATPPLQTFTPRQREDINWNVLRHGPRSQWGPWIVLDSALRYPTTFGTVILRKRVNG
ncbi:alpha-2 adrenergic receptor [Trichonephila clavipes]|nr:alpha-2 adrenergic receptor [Trichonephila clavipes]